MTIEIRRASPADIPRLAGLLARAFREDPMVTWPLVTPDDLEARIRVQFELLDTPFAAEGWMHEADGGLGVMSLIPPDTDDRAHAIDGAVATGMAALSPDGGARYTGFWAWIEACVPAERHWLLDQVAVEPEAQGRGIGTSLVGAALERAAADGLPLFLETGVARNVDWYERFGFTVMHAANAPGGGPLVWFMRRDPDQA